MACEEKGKNDRRINQFYKIRLLNDIANQIAYFGIQNGNEKLLDYIDMNCGGIPEGNFEQVIDLSSPHQFLAMYTQIAENRFAFAVTEILKMNPQYIEILKEFLTRTGRELNIFGDSSSPTGSTGSEEHTKSPTDFSMDAIFVLFQSFILDGMPCDGTKQILSSNENEIVWKKLVDTHESAWKKAGGNIDIYYELEKSFVSGLFEKVGITLSIENNEIFKLERV